MANLRTLLGIGVFMLSTITTSVVTEKLDRKSANVVPNAIEFPKPRYAAGIVLPEIDLSEVEAESFIVTTASGVTLAERDSRKPLPIASLTKTMTALILEERGAESVILLSDTAKNILPKQSSLPIGETISKDMARVLILVESDNDVAEAVSGAVGPLIQSDTAPRDAFIRAMNEKAAALGMTMTHFVNPTGLDEKDHYSSAADLAILLGYIDIYHPNFWSVTANPPPSLVALSGRSYTVKSSNLLAGYPGLEGIKTGLTDEAMGALAMKYRLTGFPEDIFMVILRSPDRFRDGERMLGLVRRAFQAGR